MKNNIYILGFLVLLISSCKKDFKEINTNPNAPTNVRPELLLRQIIYNYGEEMAYEGFVAGNLLAQHFTMVDFNLFDRHDLNSPQLGGNPWSVLYKNLRDNSILLNQAQENSVYAVYEGPARILKAYISATLTDIYGDVPYSEAAKGTTGTVSPVYDSQELIYTGEDGILDNLDKGILVLQNYNSGLGLEGDLLFNGNLTAWISFARSLKLKYLIRISNKVNVSQELQNLYNTGDYIANNSKNASFDFSNDRPNSFRMQQLRDGDFNLFILSETMETVLNNWNDPRIKVLFQAIGSDSTGSQYKGFLNGPDAAQTSISVADYSLTGTIFRTHTGDLDANFLTAWETHFLWAEAAERGLIAANAQMHYEKGVELAFEYWHTALPSDYLSTGNAAYGSNGQNKLEQIITQKWVANSINGYEGWIEYKRTGFPKLKTLAASLNNDLIPLRMPYPTDEAALNSTNYNIATSSNNNSINAAVWWDVD